MDQGTLDEIQKVLHREALNYGVSLRWYEVREAAPASSAALIGKAFGPQAILSEIRVMESEAIWPKIEDALLYAGDDSHGPSAATVASEELASLTDKLRHQVEDATRAATEVEAFRLHHRWHPFYPVFWDFAFLFRTAAGATILIGSSSD